MPLEMFNNLSWFLLNVGINNDLRNSQHGFSRATHIKLMYFFHGLLGNWEAAAVIHFDFREVFSTDLCAFQKQITKR